MSSYVGIKITWTLFGFFFFSSRRRHTRFDCDWSSDVCSSDLAWRSRDRQVVADVRRLGNQMNVVVTGCARLIEMVPAIARNFGNLGAALCLDQIGRASCRERV